MSISLFKKGKVTQSGGGGTGDGTFTSPYDWTQVSTGSDKTVVDKVDMISVKLPWPNYGVYVRVNLTAGTEYRLFMNSDVTDTLIAIYNADAEDEESSIEINDDWDEAGSCLYFTPSVTGDYLILYTSYPRFLEGETDYTTTIDEASVNPAPNNITAGGSEITYTYETSSGFDAFGYPIKGDIASDILKYVHEPSKNWLVYAAGTLVATIGGREYFKVSDGMAVVGWCIDSSGVYRQPMLVSKSSAGADYDKGGSGEAQVAFTYSGETWYASTFNWGMGSDPSFIYGNGPKLSGGTPAECGIDLLNKYFENANYFPDTMEEIR